jgi:membrane associated rhomboid family serine protease
MNSYRPGGFQILPPVVKNILIVNGLFFLAVVVLEEKFRIDLTDKLGLYFYKSPKFKPLQLFSHLFMHGSIMHLFSNMFALWMFGSMMENVWGSKRFFVYYLVTGIGAAVLHMAVLAYTYYDITSGVDQAALNEILVGGGDLLAQHMNYANPSYAAINNLLNTPTVGASGAVFGVLLAYGMYFPNAVVYVYFAIPLKAKYFVAIYGLFELYAGFANNPGDNVAHFAHLGGMLFGFFLIRYWQNKSRRYF